MRTSDLTQLLFMLIGFIILTTFVMPVVIKNMNTFNVTGMPGQNIDQAKFNITEKFCKLSYYDGSTQDGTACYKITPENIMVYRNITVMGEHAAFTDRKEFTK